MVFILKRGPVSPICDKSYSNSQRIEGVYKHSGCLLHPKHTQELGFRKPPLRASCQLLCPPIWPLRPDQLPMSPVTGPGRNYDTRLKPTQHSMVGLSSPRHRHQSPLLPKTPTRVMYWWRTLTSRTTVYGGARGRLSWRWTSIPWPGASRAWGWAS